MKDTPDLLTRELPRTQCETMMADNERQIGINNSRGSDGRNQWQIDRYAVDRQTKSRQRQTERKEPPLRLDDPVACVREGEKIIEWWQW